MCAAEPSGRERRLTFQWFIACCADGQDRGSTLMLLPNEQPQGGAAAALQALIGATLGALLQAHGSGLDGASLAEQLSQARPA